MEVPSGTADYRLPRLALKFVYHWFYSYKQANCLTRDAALFSAYKTRSSYICSDKGLSLETSALETHYVDQFTLSTQLIIKPYYLVILHHQCSTTVSLETYPSI